MTPTILNLLGIPPGQNTNILVTSRSFPIREVKALTGAVKVKRLPITPLRMLAGIVRAQFVRHSCISIFQLDQESVSLPFLLRNSEDVLGLFRCDENLLECSEAACMLILHLEEMQNGKSMISHSLGQLLDSSAGEHLAHQLTVSAVRFFKDFALYKLRYDACIAEIKAMLATSW